MEYSYRCRADYVQIWDGLHGTQNWNSTGRYCRRPRRSNLFYSTGNLLKIRFVSDSSISNRRGFRIGARAGRKFYIKIIYGICKIVN